MLGRPVSLLLWTWQSAQACVVTVRVPSVLLLNEVGTLVCSMLRRHAFTLTLRILFRTRMCSAPVSLCLLGVVTLLSGRGDLELLRAPGALLKWFVVV